MRQLDQIKTRVLIVSRSAPDPCHGSAMHMEDMIRCLKSHGCEVHYLALCVSPQADLSRTCVDTAYFLEPHEFVPQEFDAVAQDWECQAVGRICRSAAPALVIADYSWMAGIYDEAYFRENPSVRKVIFVHDLRVRILPSYVTMGLIKSEANTWTEEREGTLLSRADALLTLNDEDQRAAAAMAPRARVLKMGMSVAPQYVDASAAVPGRCLYVASGATENLFAVMWPLKYAWPRVRAANKSASLAICGSVCDKLKEVIDSGNSWLGGVDGLNLRLEGRKDDLKPYYASAQIALVPHWMNGGIKIKHLEAIAHGLAVVCTPAGADGLPEAVNRSALVAEMPNEFADHILRRLKDKAALAGMRRSSRDLSLQLTPDAVYREVIDYVRAG